MTHSPRTPHSQVSESSGVALYHLSLSCNVPFPQLYLSNIDPSTKSATLTFLASTVHPGYAWLPGYRGPPQLLPIHLQSITLYENLCWALSTHQRPSNPCKPLLSAALAPTNHTAPPLRMF